jgi:hypothetical protein
MWSAAMQDELIFIYNADGGIFSIVSDAVHKLISPQTYACSLCVITYGAVSMRTEWKRALDRLDQRTTFLHRDEFARAFPALEIALPAILLRRGDHPPHELIGADELNAAGDVDTLIALLHARLRDQPQ